MTSRTLLGRLAAIALGVALLAAPAAAQRAQSWEIGAFGGGYFGSTIYSATGTYTGTVGLNSAFGYGARLGYNVNRGFGVEFSWSSSDPSMTFSGYGASRPSGSLQVNNFDFDAMFNFGQQRIWGYFAFGFGWSDYSPTVNGSNGLPVSVNSQSYFSGNTALGMKAFLNPHIAVQLDARYRWSATNHQTSSGYGCTIYYYCYNYASNYYGAGELTAGLTYIGFK